MGTNLNRNKLLPPNLWEGKQLIISATKIVTIKKNINVLTKYKFLKYKKKFILFAKSHKAVYLISTVN